MAEPRKPGLALHRWAATLVLLASSSLLPNAGAQQLTHLSADGMSSRVLACTTCHAKDGRATPDGYFPRIAGKPAGYLYNQLLNFREGRRSYPQMSYLLEHLTDEYLLEIAQHFASLRLPYAPPSPAPQVPAALIRQGQKLVQQGDPGRDLAACVACHGQALMGVSPWVPGLLGLSRDYVAAQLGAWQTGQRHAQTPDCMAAIARRLSAQEVGAIAAWLSSQPVPPDAVPAAWTDRPAPMRCGGVQAATPLGSAGTSP